MALQQLTGVDASFLSMETAATFGHVASVSVFEPGDEQEPLTLERLRRVVEPRLHLLPPLRRRLVDVPFGLDRPYWADDPDFDLDFHLRELALAPPGTDQQLAEQVARIVARPLDRRRPLWEIYLVHGLDGGRFALLAKFHHAAVDGVGGREVMTTLLDAVPDPAPDTPPPPFSAPPLPGEAEMLVRGWAGLARQPLKALRLQRRALASLPATAKYAVRLAAPAVRDPLHRLRRGWQGGEGRLLSAPRFAAPRTPFNRPITPHRRWAPVTLRLAEVKALKAAYGVTVNDVVMTLCASALRRWLSDAEDLPNRPLLTMVPISVRTEEQAGAYGNRVSAMIAELPTDEPDPVRRLRRTHEALRTAKEQHKAVPADVLADASDLTMPALAARASRVAARVRLADWVDPPFNLVISNVPGPQTPLYLAGARMKHYYPVSVLTDGLGLNITVQSYLGNLDFGLLACRELVPDVDVLAGHLPEALEELRQAAAS
jgi:diacylglycerol O-acyltransferase